MKDAALHTILFAAFGLIIWAVFVLLPSPTAAAVVGCLVGFIRELTQAQARTDNNFLTCWDVWNWSASKLAETFIPAILVITIASIVF